MLASTPALQFRFAHWERHKTRMRTMAAGAEVELSSGEVLRCRAVVGADGTKSRIAGMLGLKRASYAGEVYFRCPLRLLALLCCVFLVPTACFAPTGFSRAKTTVS